MDEPVVVKAYIHEGAEVDHISDSPRELVTYMKVLYVQDIRAEQGPVELLAVVAKRAFYGALDICERIRVYSQFLCDLRRENGVLLPESAYPAGLHKRPRAFVALRVYRRHIERLVSVGYPEKSRALLECLGSELLYLQKLFSVFESAVFVAVRDYLPRYRAVEA